MAAEEQSFDEIDELAINTIRTLSIDAIQKANSGHPGTPMALAPVAYVLWQRFLRFDPERADLAQPRPLRALRRPRLDAALRAAAPDRRQRGRSRLRDRGHAGGLARRHQVVSPARLEGRRAPRVPLDLGRRDDDRPARPGHRHLGRDGDRRRSGRRRTSTGPASSSSTSTPTRSRRRLPDGGRLARGGIVRRPPAPRQPLLDLRQQPHHDRRPHRAHLRRRRRRAASPATAGTSPGSATPTTSA